VEAVDLNNHVIIKKEPISVWKSVLFLLDVKAQVTNLR